MRKGGGKCLKQRKIKALSELCSHGAFFDFSLSLFACFVACGASREIPRGKELAVESGENDDEIQRCKKVCTRMNAFFFCNSNSIS